MNRILVFCGSLRRQSYNRMLADNLCARLPGHLNVEWLNPDKVALPLYDQDLECEDAPLSQALSVHAQFAMADGIIVASPEFNGQVSSYLKNTVDWVSRIPRIAGPFAAENPFLHKPVLLCSASTGGSGGTLGLQSARALFSYLGCLVLPEQICLSDVESLVFGQTFAFARHFDDYIANTLRQFATVTANNPLRANGQADRSRHDLPEGVIR